MEAELNGDQSFYTLDLLAQLSSSKRQVEYPKHLLQRQPEMPHPELAVLLGKA